MKRYTPEWKKKISSTLKDKSPSLHVRLFSKAIQTTSGCWEYVGARLAGYGVIQVNGMAKKAHRVAWECTYGQPPIGKFICHSCDNPACIRPDHLFAMTCLENEIDKYAKRRNNSRRTYTQETRAILSEKLKRQHAEWKKEGRIVGRPFKKGHKYGMATRFKKKEQFFE